MADINQYMIKHMELLPKGILGEFESPKTDISPITEDIYMIKILYLFCYRKSLRTE